MENQKAFEYYIGKRESTGVERVKITGPGDVNKFARQFLP